MAGNYGANQYKQAAVTTASRGQVLIMLYEAAVRHCKNAAAAIEKKDTAQKGVSIGKVHDIINELLNSLDHSIGGEITKNLESLYNFMITELLQANIHSSVEKVQKVQKNLETLLEGWRVAVAEVNKGSSKTESKG